MKTGVIPINVEIKNEIRLSKEVQEFLLGKSLDSIKIVGYGATK